MKKLARVMTISSIVAFGVVAVPFAASAEPSQTEETGTTAEALHAGGRDIMERALSDVDLRPDQQSGVDRLKAEAKARHAPVKKAKRELMLSLADQIENGKIDRCALAPQMKALASAMADAVPGDRAAFERLHTILDPDQRSRFVDSLKQRSEWRKKEMDPSAHAEKMAKELNLTADQKVTIQRILTALNEIREAEPGRAEHRQKWSKILDAFKSDHFDLDEIAPKEDIAAKSTRKLDRALWGAEAIVPVLNDQQRATAAQKIRDYAQQSGKEREPSPGMEPGKEREGGPSMEPGTEREGGPSTEPGKEREGGPSTEPGKEREGGLGIGSPED